MGGYELEFDYHHLFSPSRLNFDLVVDRCLRKPGNLVKTIEEHQVTLILYFSKYKPTEEITLHSILATFEKCSLLWIGQI